MILSTFLQKMWGLRRYAVFPLWCPIAPVPFFLRLRFLTNSLLHLCPNSAMFLWLYFGVICSAPLSHWVDYCSYRKPNSRLSCSSHFVHLLKNCCSVSRYLACPCKLQMKLYSEKCLLVYFIRFSVVKRPRSREGQRFPSGLRATKLKNKQNWGLLTSKIVVCSLQLSVFLLQLPSSWVGSMSLLNYEQHLPVQFRHILGLVTVSGCQIQRFL